MQKNKSYSFIIPIRLLGVFFLFTFWTGKTHSIFAQGDPKTWIVAVNGQPGNAGTSDSPWDLGTALSGKMTGPGDTILLKGGTYHGSFNSHLKGSADHPVVVKSFTNEWAKIVDNRSRGTGGTLNIFGAWTIYRDFEVTNLNPQRGANRQFRPMGINIQAPYTKFINLIIHDTGMGFGFWEESENAEIYGNIIYNCGSTNTPHDLTHGHGIYSQNKNGIKIIENNIIFNQFGFGIHLYPNPGGIQGYHLKRNVIFNSGAYFKSGARLSNLLISGYTPYQADNIELLENYTYQRNLSLLTKFSDANACLGCQDSITHKRIVIKNNYFAGGAPIVLMNNWQNVEFDHNTLIGGLGMVVLATPLNQSVKQWNWNNNTYQGIGINNNSQALFGLNVNEKIVGWTDWQKLTGFDQQSQFILGKPRGTKVFILENKYEPGRAHIVVYNWDLKDSLQISLAGILNKGQDYELKNVQNYFTDPVLSGTYDGNSLTIPLTITPAAPAWGAKTRPPSVEKEFQVFILTTRSPTQQR